MRLVWCTDPHLKHLPPAGPKVFGERVRRDHPDLDGVLVTGDIAECDSFLPLLDEFQKGLDAPVWYVLGNHDAYGGSVSEMKAKAHAHTNAKTLYLEKEKLVELSPGVALVGHDGWYDARNGDPIRSNVALNDFLYIREFFGHWGHSLISVARRIADADAEEACGLLEAAVTRGYKRILFATHVPPYAQSAWHMGEVSNAHWLPWMSNRVLGEVLDVLARDNPDVSFTVLCGHTHSAGRYQRHANVEVLTGHSEYGDPRVSGTFEF